MATTNTGNGTSKGRHASASAEASVKKGLGDLQEAAGELKSAAYHTGKELQSAAERELASARGNAHTLSRQAALMIRRNPWTAVGAALLLGAVASRLL